MKVKAVKVNRAHYFLTDPRIKNNQSHPSLRYWWTHSFVDKIT